MSYLIICLSAMLVSGLTLFSGFGLGTLLMPAFALFFSVEVAALGYFSHLGEIFRYTMGSRTGIITPLKLVMGFLMLGFAFFELLPRLQEMKFDRKYLFLGGVLSGFFGGFSGHQGALRSAFLAKVGISTQAFVGTNAVIGFMVDMVRIATYAMMFFSEKASSSIGSDQWPLIITGIAAAFAGVMLGKLFIHKVTMKTIQTVTGVLLAGIAVALTSGII